MNFTDVDDRTIISAQKAGMDLLHSCADQHIASVPAKTPARWSGGRSRKIARATDLDNIAAMGELNRSTREEGPRASQRRLHLVRDFDDGRLREAGASLSISEGASSPAPASTSADDDVKDDARGGVPWRRHIRRAKPGKSSARTRPSRLAPSRMFGDGPCVRLGPSPIEYHSHGRCRPLSFRPTGSNDCAE